MRNRFYGWQADLPDRRDRPFSARPEVLARLPARVDLRRSFPRVRNQLTLGSCMGHALAGIFQFDIRRQDPGSDFQPSPLFIYYNARMRERTVNSDAGAQLRSGIKSLAHEGVCCETLWPYIIKKFADKPDPWCYEYATCYTSLTYSRVPRSLPLMKACLAGGFPFAFGFAVYESFESEVTERTGRVQLPADGEDSFGGHAVVATGYDDARRVLFIRNSYGEEWGYKGYGTIPYDYVTDEDLSDDFWTIRGVHAAAA